DTSLMINVWAFIAATENKKNKRAKIRMLILSKNDAKSKKNEVNFRVFYEFDQNFMIP
ncbi:MAG: hypothetical protein RL632_2306, partial [Bacteroidota bacterium]